MCIPAVCAKGVAWFQPNCELLVGLIVTLALVQFVVPSIVRCARSIIGKPECPRSDLKEYWEVTLKNNPIGGWIGLIEGPIFFAAIWSTQIIALLGTWVVFKTAFNWQGAKFAALPESLAVFGEKQDNGGTTEEEIKWQAALFAFGRYRSSTIVFGTGLNIVMAIIGVGVGHWLKLH